MHIVSVIVTLSLLLGAQTGAVDESCGGHITGPSGVLATPRHPAHYPNGTHCIWLLEGAPGTLLNLTILGLDAESSNGQCRDFLEVRAGSRESAVLYRGCDVSKPLPVLSPHHWLWLRFYATEFISATGLKATWRAVALPPENFTVHESPVIACPHTRFSCSNGECLSWSYVCDGFPDCGCGAGCDEDVCGDSKIGASARVSIGVLCGVLIFSLTLLFVAVMEKQVRWRKHSPRTPAARKPSYVLQQEQAEAALRELKRQQEQEQEQQLEQIRRASMRPAEEESYFCGTDTRPQSARAKSAKAASGGRKFSLFRAKKPTIVVVETSGHT